MLVAYYRVSGSIDMVEVNSSQDLNNVIPERNVKHKLSLPTFVSILCCKHL
jgi:hypothetical protein